MSASFRARFPIRCPDLNRGHPASWCKIIFCYQPSPSFDGWSRRQRLQLLRYRISRYRNPPTSLKSWEVGWGICHFKGTTRFSRLLTCLPTNNNTTWRWWIWSDGHYSINRPRLVLKLKAAFLAQMKQSLRARVRMLSPVKILEFTTAKLSWHRKGTTRGTGRSITRQILPRWYRVLFPPAVRLQGW